MTDSSQSHDAQDASTVTVAKVYTHNGERLAIRSGEHAVKLDALELESVSWQAPDAITQLVERFSQPKAPLSTIDCEFGDETVTIKNEYGVAQVSLVDGDGTDGLRVTAPKLGYEITLSPADLHMLSQQGRETFSEFLKTPFGPSVEDDDHVDWH